MKILNYNKTSNVQINGPGRKSIKKDRHKPVLLKKMKPSHTPTPSKRAVINIYEIYIYFGA